MSERVKSAMPSERVHGHLALVEDALLLGAQDLVVVRVQLGLVGRGRSNEVRLEIVVADGT